VFLIFIFTATLVSTEVAVFVAKEARMYPESDDLSDYLVSDAIVDWQTPVVRHKALELTASLTDEVEKARCLYEWVRDSISHSADADSDMVTCTASEVLQQGTGICFAKSHLLAALLRAVNIPAGFCYQVLRCAPLVDDETVLHGLNAVYLASLGKWLRVDARGNTQGINAQFNLQKEQLAFSMDPAADEFIYEAIFAAPVRSVVERLKMYRSRRELCLDLPQSL
jgi:transglutaminase-like putative cysteine protease